MSLKPKKYSERKKKDLAEKMKTQKSTTGTKTKLPPYTLIVSEGVKTEPLYLKGLVDKINAQFKDLTRNGHIYIYGTGRNTKNLLYFVDRKINSGEWERYERIWLVYDKDDFPLDNFDNTQFSAENRKNTQIKVAWSNESFELWLLLHFQDYLSNNGRKDYIEKLNRYMEYSKTREDLFEVMSTLGSVKEAKRRAKRMYEEFVYKCILIPSQMVPATRVYELVEELETYLQPGYLSV